MAGNGTDRARTDNLTQISGRSLTLREQEIVTLLLQAHTNRQIANLLGLSEHTVKVQLGRLYAKVGVEGRLELVSRVLRRV